MSNTINSKLNDLFLTPIHIQKTRGINPYFAPKKIHSLKSINEICENNNIPKNKVYRKLNFDK